MKNHQYKLASIIILLTLMGVMILIQGCSGGSGNIGGSETNTQSSYNNISENSTDNNNINHSPNPSVAPSDSISPVPSISPSNTLVSELISTSLPSPSPTPIPSPSPSPNSNNSSCGGGGSGGATNTEPEPAKYTPGNNTILMTETVGVAGKILEAPADSPLAGVKVEFPAGALSNDTIITLGYNDGIVTPAAGQFSGRILEINSSGQTEFEIPIIITIPLPDSNTIAIPYYIDSDGNLLAATLIDIDTENKTATFITFHISLFTWLWVIDLMPTIPQSPFPPLSIYTVPNYRACQNGFQVDNQESNFNPGGNCHGMSAFSIWYYRNRNFLMNNYHHDSNLFIRYMTNVNFPGINDYPGQWVVAARAQISVQQQDDYYNSLIRKKLYILSNSFHAKLICNALINTKNPVMVKLTNYIPFETVLDWPPIQTIPPHCIVIYGCEEGRGMAGYDYTFYCYDPNRPGIESILTINALGYMSYSGYSRVVLYGDGSIRVTEPFRNIVEDAEHNFNVNEQDGSKAKITITSHTDGQNIDPPNSPSIVLKGTIDSVEVLVTRLVILLNGMLYKCDVKTDGTFEIPITLQNGKNIFKFQTRGKNGNGNLIYIPSNMDNNEFTLKYNSGCVMQVTVIWGRNDTDVDLYVIDPTNITNPNGDGYSCYYHKVTTDGGELDCDDTDGFGPENWTLATDDVIRYGQLYKVRLHYYSDHGNGATTYKVIIRTYKTDPNDPNKIITDEKSYYGNLSYCNSNNDAPNDIGADWRDIDTIILDEPTNRIHSIASPVDLNSSVSNILMKTFIPSLDERKNMKKMR